MKDWKDISINEIGAIYRVVGVYKVDGIQDVPYNYFYIRIEEKSNGYFYGYPTLMIKENGEVAIECGAGSTVEEALEDTINVFLRQVKSEKEKYGNLTEDNFEWGEVFQ